ncbi:MAG TPA: hypothetical protein VL101_08715, partial [Nordella sp.]|nr:hypothetical protein [Nordella sp.]
MRARHLISAAAVIALLAVAAAAYLWTGETTPERPDIPFAPLADTSLKDPDNPLKIFHVDFAKLEHDMPLSR